MTCSDEVLTVKMLLLRKFSCAEKFTTDARRVFANWKTIFVRLRHVILGFQRTEKSLRRIQDVLERS